MEVATPVSNVTSSSSSAAEKADWHFLQCFGERSPGEDIQDARVAAVRGNEPVYELCSRSDSAEDSGLAADIISAVEFDHQGQYLATGDRGGRVVIFERGYNPPASPHIDERPGLGLGGRLGSLEYRYLTEFQSHEPEFDYLKSLEIEEKINKVQWVPHHTGTQLILSTNDKTVKLWKVYEKQVTSLAEYNVRGSWSIPAGAAANVTITSKALKLAGKSEEKLQQPLRIPKVVRRNATPQARCSRVYANAHAYHINSVSMSSDRETFLSADDLRVNLWHLDVSSCSFNILNIKPNNMEELTEVITCAEFHPHMCHSFAYSSSKGGIKMGDLRASALCDRHAKSFEALEPPGQRSFFSEIISSISSMRFSRDGRYILARDYMTLKLWDLKMENHPVAVYNIHDNLRPKLCELYENDCIFDKFSCCMSGDSSQMLTGTYTNLCRILKKDGEWPSKTENILEASRDPLRKRNQVPKVTSRFGLTRGSAAKRAGLGAPANGAGVDGDPSVQDFSAKLLHLAWHPEDDIIAAAAANSLYMYCKR